MLIGAGLSVSVQFLLVSSVIGQVHHVTRYDHRNFKTGPGSTYGYGYGLSYGQSEPGLQYESGYGYVRARIENRCVDPPCSELRLPHAKERPHFGYGLSLNPNPNVLSESLTSSQDVKPNTFINLFEPEHTKTTQESNREAKRVQDVAENDQVINNGSSPSQDTVQFVAEEPFKELAMPSQSSSQSSSQHDESMKDALSPEQIPELPAKDAFVPVQIPKLPNYNGMLQISDLIGRNYINTELPIAIIHSETTTTNRPSVLISSQVNLGNDGKSKLGAIWSFPKQNFEPQQLFYNRIYPTFIIPG